MKTYAHISSTATSIECVFHHSTTSTHSVSTTSNLLSPDWVHVDVSIGGSSKQSVTIRRPLQGHAPWDTGLWDLLGSQLIQDVLVLQIPDLDTSVSGSAQPVVLWTETHSINRR